MVVDARDDLNMLTTGNKLCTYTEDTSLFRSATFTWSAEVENIETWARTNLLTLNRTISKENVVIDNDKKRNRLVVPRTAATICYD